LRDDELGELWREKPFQPPDPAQLLDLFRDPRFEATVQFGDLLGPLPQFAEQPRIFNRDDRLIGEGLKQCDLLVAEWPHLLTNSYDYAEQDIVFAQRYGQDGSRAGPFDGCLHQGMVDLGLIRDVDKAGPVEEGLSDGIVDRADPLAQPFGECVRPGTHGHGPKLLAVIERQGAVVRAAEGPCLLQDRVEDGRQLAGR